MHASGGSQRRENICVFQVGNQEPDLDQPGEELYSASMLWTFLYCKMHGYTYKMVVDKRIHGPADSPHHGAWLKAHNLSPLLLQCDMVVLLDFDVLFSNLSVTIEQKLADWNFSERTLVLQALDPDMPENYMEHTDGKKLLNGNTGFMVLRGRNKKVQRLVKYWSECPEKVPGCEVHKDSLFKDQAAWNAFVRPQLEPEEIILLPCSEANGHSGTSMDSHGCTGGFVSHFWNAKEILGGLIQNKLLKIFTGELAEIVAGDRVISRS